MTPAAICRERFRLWGRASALRAELPLGASPAGEILRFPARRAEARRQDGSPAPQRSESWR